MLSFNTFILEEFLLENKAWHQFIKQYGIKLLEKLKTKDEKGIDINHADHYLNNDEMKKTPGYGTPEHLTDYISSILGIKDVHREDGMWILKKLFTGEIPRTEDVGRVKENLTKLRSYKDRGIQVPQLSGIKNHSELHNAIQDLENAPSVDFKRDLSELYPSDYQIIGENEHWHVVLPLSHKAACTVGKGSNWCTQEEENFNDYSRTGQLISFIPRNPKVRNERYQFHLSEKNPSSVQIMDANDVPIGIQSIPNFSERPLPEILPPNSIDSEHGGNHVHFALKTIKKVDSFLSGKPVTFDTDKEMNVVLHGIIDGGNDSHISKLIDDHINFLNDDMLRKIIYRSSTNEEIVKNLGKRKLKKDHISSILDNLHKNILFYPSTDERSKFNRAQLGKSIIAHGNIEHIFKAIDILGSEFNDGHYDQLTYRFSSKRRFSIDEMKKIQEKIIDNSKENLPYALAHDILRDRKNDSDGGEGTIDKIISKGFLTPKIANALFRGSRHQNNITPVSSTIIGKIFKGVANHSKNTDSYFTTFKNTSLVHRSQLEDSMSSIEGLIDEFGHQLNLRKGNIEEQQTLFKESEESIIDLLKSIHHRKLFYESITTPTYSTNYASGFSYITSLSNLFKQGSNKLRHAIIDNLIPRQTITSNYYSTPTQKTILGDWHFHQPILSAIDHVGDSALRDKFMHRMNYNLSDSAQQYIATRHVTNPEYEQHIKKIINFDLDDMKASNRNDYTTPIMFSLAEESPTVNKRHEFLHYLIDSAHNKGVLTPAIQKLFTRDYNHTTHRQKIISLLGNKTDDSVIKEEIKSGGYHIDNVFEKLGSSLKPTLQHSVLNQGSYEQVAKMIDLLGKKLDIETQTKIIAEPYRSIQLGYTYNQDLNAARANVDKLIKLHGSDLKNKIAPMIKLQEAFSFYGGHKHIGDMLDLVGDNLHHSVLPTLMNNKNLTDEQANRVLDVIHSKMKNNRTVSEHSNYVSALDNFINRTHTTSPNQNNQNSGNYREGVMYKVRNESDYHTAIDSVLQRFGKTYPDLLKTTVSDSIGRRGNDSHRNMIYKLFNP